MSGLIFHSSAAPYRGDEGIESNHDSAAGWSQALAQAAEPFPVNSRVSNFKRAHRPSANIFRPLDNSYAKSVLSGNAESVYGDLFSGITPTVSSSGTVCLILGNLVRVDISSAKSVCVTNYASSSVSSMNGSGDKSCVFHPNGRVYHDSSEINFETLDRKASISQRGILFTSSDRWLSYVEDDDASGSMVTSEKFRHMDQDFISEVFDNNNCASQDGVGECFRMLAGAEYKRYRDGYELWCIGGYRIKLDPRGGVTVIRNRSLRYIFTSPVTGRVVLKSFQYQIKIGPYPNNYFSVRLDDKRVFARSNRFFVQNCGRRGNK